MFRDLYKQANDEIKGDKLIIEKAFMKANAPVKKKLPMLKYSFIGTAAVAVFIIGAVFLNADVLFKREFAYPDTKTTQGATEGYMRAVITEETGDETDDVIVSYEAPSEIINSVTTTKEENNTLEGSLYDYVPEESAEPVGDYGQIMVLSSGEGDYPVAYEDDAEDAWEENTEAYQGSGEGVLLWSFRREVEDSTGEAATETVKTAATATDGWEYAEEEEDAEFSANREDDSVSYGVFSYMYDLSVYGEDPYTKTDGFVNTDEKPIENGNDAIERAKNECTVEYDTVNACYDPIEAMWRVDFWIENMLGESVYLSSNGVTQMIVYGE